MKQTIMFLGMLSIGFTQAQVGKVGVNTEAPKETLEVKGTVKVTNLPTHNQTNAIYNGAETLNTTFIEENIVLSNTDGVLGKQNKKAFKDEMNRSTIEELDDTLSNTNI